MSETAQPVTVIVPHYDDLVRLDLCLASLQGQTYDRGAIEIVVADNNSPCGRDAVARTIAGRAELVVCMEKGAGPARNAGVAAASHALLAFTDSDCVADAGWLEAGIAALAHADLVGGEVTVSVPHPGSRSGSEAFEQVFAFHNRTYVEKLGFSVTANLFTRSSVFDAVGGFGSNVSEDLEWCRRAVAAGYKLVYQSAAVVRHPARATWQELTKKWARLQAEQLATESEKPGGRARWILRSWALPLSALVHAPQALGSPALDNFGERARCLVMLVRLRCWRFVHAQSLVLRQR